jgi:hypothetical protein
MGQRNTTPAASQRYLQSTTVAGGVTVTLTIPAGETHTSLAVIDNILWTGQCTGSGALTITVNAVIVARKQLANITQPEYGQIDFSAGWPLFNASGSDSTPLGATDVVLTGVTTLSNACLTVLYHYAAPGELRN